MNQNRRSSAAAFVFFSVLAACGGASAPPASAPTVAKKSAPAGLSQIENMCARIASCARPYDPPSVREPSECVDKLLLHGAEDDNTKCLVRAQSCKEISGCLHGDGSTGAMKFCNEHPGAFSACDGPRFITCTDPVEESSVIDCAAIGANCAENKLEGGLVVRGCSSPTLCFPGAPETRCVGDREVVSCRDGLVEKTTCSAGDRCISHHDPEGEQIAACAETNEKRCTDVGASECDGNHLVECVPDGHFGRVRTTDCAAHGLACGAQGRAAACVAASPAECAPFPPKCDGGFLVYCAEGVVAKVACAEIGLGVCDPSAHGPEAACRPRP